MRKLLEQMSELNEKEKVGDNLIVENIIVNKDNVKKRTLTYIATEKWIDQLGDRLQISY